MFLASLAFLCGIVFLQSFSALPGQEWILISLSCAILGRIYAWRYTKWLVFFLFGFAWALSYAGWQLAHKLPTELEGKTLHALGYVASIPNPEAHHQTTFLFKIIRLDGKAKKYLVHLSWQNAPLVIHAGDCLQIAVRLKRIHGLANPGGFDYEAYSLTEGIHAHGYVIHSAYNQKLSANSPSYFLDRMRESLRDRINHTVPVSVTRPFLVALAVGLHQGITSHHWQVLRNTGTNHLMAIAGLHLGFMSALTYGLVGFCWRRIPRASLKIPAQEAGKIAALILTFLYSAMAGFSLPTQRACLMLTVFLLVSLGRRTLFSLQAWSLALIVILIWNPLSVLTSSFWLSFYSIFLIIYGMNGRLKPQGLWWEHGRVQWLITLGLVPLGLFFFQECSLISLLANALAIPCIGFLILPLTVLGTLILLFSETVGGFILTAADHLLQILWSMLTIFSQLPFASWQQTIPSISLMIMLCLCIFILLIPKGLPGRWLGIIGCMLCFAYPKETPRLGEIKFTLLDVGQGLAAVIQTQKHVLVFDTGAKFSDQYDMGESVVLPFLRAEGIKKIDMLVISHGDNDHSGGALAVIQQIPVIAIKSSVPNFIAKKTDLPWGYCLANAEWQWDDVTFTFLYPANKNLGLGNDSSCVLKVTNAHHSILLTGDIEKLAENQLLQTQQAALTATILVAPHHGSKTSAMHDFIAAIDPKIVLFAVGYRNRYHFPHPTVRAAYAERGVIAYDSVQMGALQFQLRGDTAIPLPHAYRLEHHHYWNS